MCVHEPAPTSLAAVYRHRLDDEPFSSDRPVNPTRDPISQSLRLAGHLHSTEIQIHQQWAMSIQVDFFQDTTEQERILCKEYWELNPSQKFVFTVAELAKRHGLKTAKITNLVNRSCTARWTQRRCLDCGVEYPVGSRSELSRIGFHANPAWKCNACQDTERERAQIASEQAMAELKARIKADCDLSKRKPINVYSLSLEHAVYLLTVIRGGASEDISHIKPLNSLDEPLAPNPELEEEIVMSLYRAGLLHIHPDSPPTAFADESPNWRFYHRKVFWAPPIGEGLKSFEILNELEELARDKFFLGNPELEIIPLWRKIAVAECIEYLDLSMKKHGLPSNPGPKTHATLSILLHTFSVSQLYSFIWRATKDAAAFFLRERVAKTHAANTVVGSIQRQADMARARGWSVSAYKRLFECPQSQLSRVLFGSFLQVGDAGFTTPLGEAFKIIPTGQMLNFDEYEPET